MKKVVKTIKKKIVKEVAPHITAMECAEVCVKSEIDKLTLSFPNEDMNKLVEKLNEVIEKYNGSI